MKNSILKIEKPLKKTYIYGLGTAGKWLATSLKGKVAGFIDSDKKKATKKFNEIPVYSPSEAKLILDSNSYVIVTVLDIQDIIENVSALPTKDWVALGCYLNDTKVDVNLLGENISYVEYALKAVEECHKAYFSKDKLFLKAIDVVITERCSLKCKDCSNLMQYYSSPDNIPFDEIIKDFDKLLKSVDHVYELRLIGGEPFMNKDIYKILQHLCNEKKINKIVIYTNATIPLKTDQLDVLKNHKIVFSVTDYGNLSRNTSKVIKTLEENQIPYRHYPPQNWTDSGVIHDYKRNTKEMEDLFDQCCGKNLLTATDGLLFRCPFAANAHRLKAIPFDKKNSIPLGSPKSDIADYTSKISYLPACNYCKGRSYGSPEIEPAIQTKKPLKYKIYDLMNVS